MVNGEDNDDDDGYRDDGDKPIVIVHKPKHRHVTRTQSVIVEYDVLNFVMPDDGYAIVVIDGNAISQMEHQQVQLAVPLLSEGLHSLDVVLVDVHGKPTGYKTHVDFQVSTLWGANMFNRTEVFVLSPWSGQILANSDPLMLKLQVNNGDHRHLHAIVRLDGKKILNNHLVHPYEMKLDGIANGQHFINIDLVDDDNGEETEGTAFVQFELVTKLPSPTPQMLSQPPSLDQLCVGVLVSMGPATLFNTLESYRAAGLLDSIGQLIVFVQSQDPVLWKVASQYTEYVRGFAQPIGKGNAWRYIADTCHREFVVFVEEDFELVENLAKAEQQFVSAMEILRPGIAQLIRMRSRKMPGEPLWAERAYIDEGHVDDTHLLHYVHFWNHLHVRYPDKIFVCHRHPIISCARSSHADYTNNPAMYRVSWLRENIGDHLSRDDFNTMERRMRFSGWWERANITVGHGDGLFMHNRTDRNDDENPNMSLLVKGQGRDQSPNRNVRIAFLHHAMWVGGVERQILFLCKKLDRQQAFLDIHVVLYMERGPLAKQFEELGISVTVIPVYNTDWTLKHNSEQKKKELVDFLKDFDIVHAWYGGGDLGTYNTFPTQISHEANVHVLINMAWTVPVVDPNVAVAVMENDRLMEIHAPVFRIYKYAPGFDLPAIIRIDVGVDLNAFPFVDRSRRATAERKMVVGRVSRLVPEKDPSTFVEAANIILKQRSDVRFVIWGDGSERESLERLAESLDISSEDLQFRGMTSEVAAALEEMDVFAYPTLGDSVGWVVLEAMASGLPIVSTHIDAVPTFVHHGKNGLLVDIRDAESMANAIMFLADDPDERLKMGKHSRHLVETRFRQDRYIKEYVELYQHLGNTRFVPKRHHLGKIK